MTRAQNCPRILKSSLFFFQSVRFFCNCTVTPTSCSFLQVRRKVKKALFDDLSKSPALMLVIKVQIHNLFGTWHSFIAVVQFFPFVFVSSRYFFENLILSSLGYLVKREKYFTPFSYNKLLTASSQSNCSQN